MKIKGTIFNIQRHSIHDGPGIRTTVFLKGCNLKCMWCHNPESIDPILQLRYYSQKCNGCKECIDTCPEGAMQMTKSGSRQYKKAACKSCGACADACYAEALYMCGTLMSAEEVMTEADKDSYYYKSSGGGITFSGGEPLMQPDFLVELLSQCKEKGYHTAIDTAGAIPRQTIKRAAPMVDQWLYDLKTINNEKHKSATGADNNIILTNLEELSASGENINIRIPIIPEFNDCIQELEDFARFIKNLPNPHPVTLLPFNLLALGKHESLGTKYKTANLRPPSKEKMAEIANIFTINDILVK